MKRKDADIQGEMLLEDLLAGIDEIGRFSPAMRNIDPALTARIMVRARGLAELLADMSRRLSQKTTETSGQWEKLPGCTLKRWRSTEGGAGVILTDNGELWIREAEGRPWLFHGPLQAGTDAQEAVDGLPGGPWRLMQRAKAVEAVAS